jgi:CheY-like chemotaxis protein
MAAPPDAYPPDLSSEEAVRADPTWVRHGYAVNVKKLTKNFPVGRPIAPCLGVSASCSVAQTWVPRAGSPAKAVYMIRILVVDDHDLVRAGLNAAFVHAGGFEVVGSCADGLQGVELAGRTRPDVILMDLWMPVLDGVEATRRIVARDPAARVVILTSAAGSRRVNDARAAGAVDCIFKDADITEMIDVVRRVAASPISGVGLPL